VRVLVIGSGLLGVTTAWFLHKNGVEVTVVDRCAEAAEETSHANAGMLTPSMSDPWNCPGVFWKLLKYIGREDSPMLLRLGALPGMATWGIRFLRNSSPARYRANTLNNVRLGNYSLGVLDSLRTELELSFDHLANGTLKFFRQRAMMDEFLELADLLSDYGVSHRRLDADEVVSLEPSLGAIRAELAGGIHYPDDGSGDARMFCRELAARAREQGVAFRYGTTVDRLVRANGRVIGVATGDGVMEADACVIAAGSYSPDLVRPCGIDLPVNPVKGYSITVACGGWNRMPRCPIIDESLHAAITPLGDRLRVAGTAELAGYDTTVREARIENLVGMLCRVLPDFRPHFDRGNIQAWAGLRPMSIDGVGVIGATPVPGLYLNTGHGHLGWTMSCGSGKLLADLVTGRPTELDISSYGLARFQG
jgi:D-amino-acid dehydrogenase